jgi:hypothetical protein
MPVIYKLVGFDRETERLAAAYEIPPNLIASAKAIAGIADRPEIVRDWPLTGAQATAIADVIKQKIDLRRQDFALEPYEAEAQPRG